MPEISTEKRKLVASNRLAALGRQLSVRGSTLAPEEKLKLEEKLKKAIQECEKLGIEVPNRYNSQAGLEKCTGAEDGKTISNEAVAKACTGAVTEADPVAAVEKATHDIVEEGRCEEAVAPASSSTKTVGQTAADNEATHDSVDAGSCKEAGAPASSSTETVGQTAADTVTAVHEATHDSVDAGSCKEAGATASSSTDAVGQAAADRVAAVNEATHDIVDEGSCKEAGATATSSSKDAVSKASDLPATPPPTPPPRTCLITPGTGSKPSQPRKTGNDIPDDTHRSTDVVTDDTTLSELALIVKAADSSALGATPKSKARQSQKAKVTCKANAVGEEMAKHPEHLTWDEGPACSVYTYTLGS